MEEFEEYHPKISLLGSIILSLSLLFFIDSYYSIYQNSWIFLLIGVGIILMGDYFLQFYKEKGKILSLFVFVMTITSGLLFVFIFFYQLVAPTVNPVSYIFFYIIFYRNNPQHILILLELLQDKNSPLSLMLNNRLWQIQFNFFGLFFFLLGIQFIVYNKYMKNRILSIGTGISALTAGIIGLVFSNLFVTVFIYDEYNYFNSLMLYSYIPLIFINLVIGFVFYRQTQERIVISPPTTKFPLISILYLVIGVGLLIPGIPLFYLSLLVIPHNILLSLRNISLLSFFILVPGFYFVLEFIKILNDYTEVQDLVLEELDEIINQEKNVQSLDEEVEVQNIEKVEYDESTDNIEQYNDPKHEYNIEINCSIEKVDNYLKSHPNYPLEDQLKMAEMEPLERTCPLCDDYLFLYKKFLIYCANCEKFISELKG